MPPSRILGAREQRSAFHGHAWAVAAAPALGLMAWITLSGLAVPGAPGPTSLPGLARTVDSEAALPSLLGFEENRGQVAPDVAYLARGRCYTFYATRHGPVLALHNAASNPGAPPAILRLQPVGGNPVPRLVGEDPLPGRVNYLRGSSPSAWRTGVPTFGRVRYEAVYPGIDLVFYDRGAELEYDVVVAPGADPSRVQLRLDGARVTLEDSGDLVLALDGGAEVRQRRPRAFQDTGGGRRDVTVAYALAGSGDAGFALGPYDPTLPLVIDPVITYATYLGGGAQEAGQDVAVDAAGHAYTTGWTMSPDFPVTGPDVALGAARDAFVARFDPAQNGAASRVFVTYLGGSRDDLAHAVALGPGGAIYVVGETSSEDFPGTTGGYQPAKALQPPAWADAFLAKLSADGSSVQYATYLGGSGGEEAYGVAVDPQGRAYISGRTESTDFPMKTPLQSSNAGIFDVIVAKLDPSLTGADSLVYSTYLGGLADESGDAIAVSAAGEAHVTGVTNSFDLPGTPAWDGFPVINALQATPGGGFDAFVFKLDATGSALVYSTYLGGPGSDNGTIYDGGIAVDPAGNAFVTGTTQSEGFPFALPAGSLDTSLGLQDAFVAKLGPNGTLSAFTYLGGDFAEYGTDASTDLAGAVHVTGSTSSPDFPTTPGALAKRASQDAFVTRLSNDLSTVLFSSFLGGDGADFAYGVAAEAGGMSWATGDTGSADFPVERAFQPAFGGPAGSGLDTFLARLGQAAATLEIDVPIGLTATTGVFPPLLLEIAQTVGMADTAGVFPPLLVEIAQTIGLVPAGGPLASQQLALNVGIGLGDMVQALGPASVSLDQPLTLAQTSGTQRGLLPVAVPAATWPFLLLAALLSGGIAVWSFRAGARRAPRP